VYYLSEESGTFNVHKMDLNNSNASAQLTDFKLHPVRFLSYGNGMLSFNYDRKLYTMKEEEQPKKLVVNITTQEINNSDKFISVNGGASQMVVETWWQT
jgi:tricorn protease